MRRVSRESQVSGDRAGPGHTMVTGFSVQNNDSSVNDEESAKVSRAESQSLRDLHRQFTGIWRSL